MKILILTDLEGCAGVADFESQTFPSGKYYEQAKELLTGEVNASCEGAFSAGAGEILVIDGHGPGGIIPEKMHPKAHLLHGRPVSKFWEMDKKWDGLFLLAHHAMNGTEDGNLNHSYSSRSVVNMWLNKEKIGEIGMNVYLAGWFGTPTVLVTGDEAACREAIGYVPKIEKAVVKWGINRTCAISRAPEAARDTIKQASKQAVKRIKEIKPVKITGACELVIEYISSGDAYQNYQKPLVEKVNPTTVRIRGKDFLDMWKKWFYG
jgi:D-amino peptidase